MTEDAPAAPPTKAPVKAVKRKSVPRAKSNALSLSKLIVIVVGESKEKKGMSLSAIKKALAAKGIDVVKSNKRINTAVVRLVRNGILVQSKGTGASGSFKLAKEPKTVKTTTKVAKRAPVRARKRAAAKKASPKKKAPAKKPVPKKSPKKVSPKKAAAKKSAKKPAAKRPTKKAATKKVAKKVAPKKASAKKTAPKKAKK
ncbi:Histone H1 [Xyrichtys novacula]|uniref:Histone H1 n=1 Tax=Xyrichtys novacula TaxID=13765 RepID=A0AAV1FQJ9_XYRNO|nr:Histone H1 [Xyrichtys novacula]